MQSRLSALAWMGVISRRAELAKEVARLRRHPRLPELAGLYCKDVTGDWLRWPVTRLIGHKGRYVICFRLIANYARWKLNAGEPPTLAALRAPAYASERQIAELIAQLRRQGLVTAVPLPTDQRMAGLHPSPRLIDAIGRHPRLMAQLYATLAEGAAATVPDLSTDQVLDLIARATTAATRETVAEAGPYPIMNHFAQRDGGFLILASIMLAHYAPDGAAVNLSRAALASRFNISLAHVDKLMREARDAGWCEAARGGGLRAISSAMVQQFEHFLAEQAAHFGTLADPPERQRTQETRPVA